MADNSNNVGSAGTTSGTDSTLQGSGPAINFEASNDLGGETETKRSASQTLKDEAGKFGTQAADRAREFAGQGKDRATSALDDLAKMMAGAADDVDAKLGAEYGRYARTAADGITNFAESLRTKEVDDLIADAGEFVRKSPVIAVGAAAAIGFALARLAKSGIDAAADLGDPEPPKA
ncbi:hypothetical protein [Sphingomonas sp. M1-B02]|uniref:hypothetical protein n=1 Tax=Sphingomonas sp. M1-B02 TaxID=3114300 RepID=UPI00223FD548|nr:hypothetical protein [Sphingomonas sp. S6-11]UZK66827.1 hypothetical protein OKW87_03020 [Sphingomonas sp. S6-11]